MKTLVIFYSLDGNTKLIANKLVEKIEMDLLELIPKKQIKNKGFSKYIWGGRQVMMGSKPELVPYSIDLNKYDCIFIGTPVWAATYAPALNTFFSNEVLKNKSLMLFVCHDGGIGKVFEKMKNRLSGNEIISQIDFRNPLGDDNIDFKIDKWIEVLK